MQPNATLLRSISNTNSNGTTLDDVIPLLKKTKPDGKGGYLACCPAHDDHNPSLSIRRGDKQGFVVHCHAGCEQKAVLDKLSDLGLPARSLRSDEPTTFYDYHDENGTPLYRVVRRGSGLGKTFFQQKSDGRGGWGNSMQGARRVPFGLPELIEAIAEDRRIYVVEGEKDVLTAREYGLTATTNAGGAGKWGDDLSAHLRDADVVILPDNDAPGREHANKVARSLNGVARSVRVVSLPRLQEKGDLTDWLCEGGSLEELQRLVEVAPLWTTTAPEGELPQSTCALHAPPPEPLSYVVDEMFIAGEPGMIFGDGGSFKTTVALHLACAVAGGYKAFGHFNTTRRPALIVSAEDGSGVLTQRMRAMCKGHGWALSQGHDKWRVQWSLNRFFAPFLAYGRTNGIERSFKELTPRQQATVVYNGLAVERAWLGNTPAYQRAWRRGPAIGAAIKEKPLDSSRSWEEIIDEAFDEPKRVKKSTRAGPKKH